jgi:8-oxo-dGTP diphosphatase
MFLATRDRHDDRVMRPMPQQQRPVVHRTIVYALISDDQDRILLVKNRGRNWSLPGGKRDAGESLTEAVRREAREEAAAEISVGPLLYVSEAPWEGSFATFHIFRGHLQSLDGRASAEDIEAVGFFDLDAASRLMPWYPEGLLRSLCGAAGVPCINEFAQDGDT